MMELSSEDLQEFVDNVSIVNDGVDIYSKELLFPIVRIKDQGINIIYGNLEKTTVFNHNISSRHIIADVRYNMRKAIKDGFHV